MTESAPAHDPTPGRASGIPPSRRAILAARLLAGALLLAGAVGLHDLFVDPAKRFLPADACLVTFAGPVLLALGLLLLLRSSATVRPSLTPRRLLEIGACMFVGGAILPWFVLPMLTGRGEEGYGVIGTIIGVLIGIPGILFLLIGLVGRLLERRTAP